MSAQKAAALKAAPAPLPGWTLKYSDKEQKVFYYPQDAAWTHAEMALKAAPAPLPGWTLEYSAKSQKVFYNRANPQAAVWTHAEMAGIVQNEWDAHFDASSKAYKVRADIFVANKITNENRHTIRKMAQTTADGLDSLWTKLEEQDAAYDRQKINAMNLRVDFKLLQDKLEQLHSELILNAHLGDGDDTFEGFDLFDADAISDRGVSAPA